MRSTNAERWTGSLVVANDSSNWSTTRISRDPEGRDASAASRTATAVTAVPASRVPGDVLASAA
jgi:hypothetical protein